MRMMRCKTYRKKHYSCEVPIHYALLRSDTTSEIEAQRVQLQCIKV